MRKKDFLLILENPTGVVQEYERRIDEPWHARWKRLTGVMPKIKEKKSVKNADPSRGRILSAAKVR